MSALFLAAGMAITSAAGSTASGATITSATGGAALGVVDNVSATWVAPREIMFVTEPAAKERMLACARAFGVEPSYLGRVNRDDDGYTVEFEREGRSVEFVTPAEGDRIFFSSWLNGELHRAGVVIDVSVGAAALRKWFDTDAVANDGLVLGAKSKEKHA